MKRCVSLMSVVVLGLLATAASATTVTVTDDFSTAHNYMTGGVTGTIWSGVLNGANATALDANTSTSGTLAIGATGAYGWETGKSNAPLLYVNVGSGDFTATVQVASVWSGNYSNAFLLARLDDASNNFVSAMAYSYSSGVYGAAMRNEVNNEQKANPYNANTGGLTWLRLARTDDTFTASYSVDGTTWTSFSSVTRADMTGSVQVGLSYGAFVSAASSTGAGFDNFSLTTTVPEPSSLALLAAGMVSLLAYAWRKRK